MNVLGIETSCDETSASVVSDGTKILSNITSSSLSFHKKYGGIVPEIAFRKQLETITQVADSAIKKADVKLSDIGLIAVTNGPGLLGSLLVGISFAKALSLSMRIPLVGVNHLYGHIYASLFHTEKIKMPFVSLVVSGGHTTLFYVKDFNRINVLGETNDDACGEAFDKVAKILGLGYPGGPIIEELAKKGNPRGIRFSCSGTKQPLNFSFSGIKTAVLYYVRRTKKHSRNDIAASFQETVIDTLIRKSFLACRLKKTGSLVIGGGVTMNKRLRERFLQEGRFNRIKVYSPDKDLSLDNAAMIAGLGFHLRGRERLGG